MKYCTMFCVCGEYARRLAGKQSMERSRLFMGLSKDLTCKNIWNENNFYCHNVEKNQSRTCFFIYAYMFTVQRFSIYGSAVLFCVWRMTLEDMLCRCIFPLLKGEKLGERVSLLHLTDCSCTKWKYFPAEILCELVMFQATVAIFFCSDEFGNRIAIWRRTFRGIFPSAGSDSQRMELNSWIPTEGYIEFSKRWFFLETYSVPQSNWTIQITCCVVTTLALEAMLHTTSGIVLIAVIQNRIFHFVFEMRLGVCCCACLTLQMPRQKPNQLSKSFGWALNEALLYLAIFHNVCHQVLIRWNENDSYTWGRVDRPRREDVQENRKHKTWTGCIIWSIQHYMYSETGVQNKHSDRIRHEVGCEWLK